MDAHQTSSFSAHSRKRRSAVECSTSSGGGNSSNEVKYHDGNGVGANRGDPLLFVRRTVGHIEIRCWQLFKAGRRLRPAGAFIILVVSYVTCSLVVTVIFHLKAQAGPGRRRMVGLKDGGAGTSSSRRRVDMVQLGYKVRPRLFGYYLDDASSKQRTKWTSGALPVQIQPYPSKRTAHWTEADEDGQKGLLNSAYYSDIEHRALQPYRDNSEECVPMHDWQTRTFPTCNNVHSIDLTDLSYSRNKHHRQVRMIAKGYFRDVWVLREYDGSTPLAFKTLRYKHPFDDWNYERHRMDAVALAELTSSPRILDIYDFCGQSGSFEYAPGGTISDAIFHSDDEARPDLTERFNMAVQVAQAISDLHNFNNKAPAIVHADIMTNQFVLVDGKYKLNDFNRCTFLYWNATSNAGNCPYYYGDYNAWLFRSPEEYEYSLQTEEIDVYSMGNIFYTLLMDKFPWDELYDKKGSAGVAKKVKKGKHPPLDKKLENSSNRMHRVLLKAMNMCWALDWRERATAKEVSDFLTAEYIKMKSGGWSKPKR